MQDFGIIALIILLVNVVVSYKGLKSHSYFDKYSFQVDKILINKEYRRLITSGFLHVSWTHLLFNMASFYCFSFALGAEFGIAKFLLIYFCSLIGGNLFCLYIHRNHGDYSAAGASGAISGLIFASIVIFPDMEVGMLFLPIHIPTWIYGLTYVLISIYGIRSQSDNIGHEAHLGGGLVGLLIAIGLEPGSVVHNYLPILLIVIPSAVFIYFILTKPAFLLVDNYFQKNREIYDVDDNYNYEKRLDEKELDRLLDKIHQKGINSLSKREKEKLEQLSSEAK
ncbi:MAG: rhomboid family intramembrane serine protease [Cytophagaceae bacterium]